MRNKLIDTIHINKQKITSGTHLIEQERDRGDNWRILSFPLSFLLPSAFKESSALS